VTVRRRAGSRAWSGGGKDAFPTDDVYRRSRGAELRLITCGGTFDRTALRTSTTSSCSCGSPTCTRPPPGSAHDDRTDDDDAAMGHPQYRRHRHAEGDPGDPAGGRLRGRGDRLARRGRARIAADALGIPVAHASYEALLAADDVDAIYVPLPNDLHAPWTIAAVEAGKHVLCEKPLAMDAAEARSMAAAADAAGVKLAEAFMYRHHPSWVEAVRLVREGAIGELRRRPELVQLLQRRSRQHPQPPRARRRRAHGHRLLLHQPLPLAVRRGAGRRAGDRAPRPGHGGGHRHLRTARVRGWWAGELHLLDADRARPAGPHRR
jgi:hypothetical protein